MPLQDFIESLCSHGNRPIRIEGTSVFLLSVSGVTPTSFMHNLKHNRVLHETCIFLTLKTEKVPYLRNTDRLSVEDLGHHCFAVTARIGFKESADVPRLLSLWRENLFAVLQRNASKAADYFSLPLNRVVELGSQVAI